MTRLVAGDPAAPAGRPWVVLLRLATPQGPRFAVESRHPSRRAACRALRRREPSAPPAPVLHARSA